MITEPCNTAPRKRNCAGVSCRKVSNIKKSFPSKIPRRALPRSSLSRRSVPRGSHCRGSLTLESALVLPVFFFAMVILISILCAGELEASGSLALSNRARKAAMAAGAAVGAAEGLTQESDAGETFAGLWIDLTDTKQIAQAVPFPGVSALRVRLHARVYPWTGYQLGSDDAKGTSGGGMVYITDYASVYHTFSDCTHLTLSVYASTTDQVGSLRNEYGSRYRPCDDFPEGYTGTVYLTTKGDRYYPSLSYAGLTRHVHLVPADEVRSLPLCERCAAREAHAA